MIMMVQVKIANMPTMTKLPHPACTKVACLISNLWFLKYLPTPTNKHPKPTAINTYPIGRVGWLLIASSEGSGSRSLRRTVNPTGGGVNH